MSLGVKTFLKTTATHVANYIGWRVVADERIKG